MSVCAWCVLTRDAPLFSQQNSVFFVDCAVVVAKAVCRAFLVWKSIFPVEFVVGLAILFYFIFFKAIASYVSCWFRSQSLI